MARLSFVAYDAYPLLAEGITEGIGGAEVRAVTFARGLADLGFDDLEFIVHPRPRMQRTSGTVALRPYQRPQGLARTVSRFRASISRRLTHLPPLDGFYRRLRTDVLFCFGVRNDTASMVRSAQASGTRVIVFLTSDRNVDDAERRGGDRGVYGERGDLCRYALQHADAVVAQTPYQREALQQSCQVNATLIRNPIALGDEGYRPPTRREVLWVGRADTFSKRAHLCVALAERLPGVEFRLVMNNHDPATFRRLVESAPANVRIIEQVPFDQIESYFQQACLLVNTSAREGFPNSFSAGCQVWPTNCVAGCGSRGHPKPGTMRCVVREVISKG